MITKNDVAKGAVERAKYLRKNATPSEQRVWFYLRSNKLGYKFRRQYPVGSFILDFFCPALKFAIEIDGENFHTEAESRERDNILAKRGISVHHILLHDVNDWDALYAEMVEAIRYRAHLVEKIWPILKARR